jgi:hypothetical protein
MFQLIEFASIGFLYIGKYFVQIPLVHRFSLSKRFNSPLRALKGSDFQQNITPITAF